MSLLFRILLSSLNFLTSTRSPIYINTKRWRRTVCRVRTIEPDWSEGVYTPPNNRTVLPMRSLLVRSILLTALTAIMAATTANVAADNSRSAYQAQIDEIERRDGTEHIDLIEPHVGLGFAAKRDLDYAAAAAAFAQASFSYFASPCSKMTFSALTFSQ